MPMARMFTVYSRHSPIGVIRVKALPYDQKSVNGLCYRHHRTDDFRLTVRTAIFVEWLNGLGSVIGAVTL